MKVNWPNCVIYFLLLYAFLLSMRYNSLNLSCPPAWLVTVISYQCTPVHIQTPISHKEKRGLVTAEQFADSAILFFGWANWHSFASCCMVAMYMHVCVCMHTYMYIYIVDRKSPCSQIATPFTAWTYHVGAGDLEWGLETRLTYV